MQITGNHLLFQFILSVETKRLHSLHFFLPASYPSLLSSCYTWWNSSLVYSTKLISLWPSSPFFSLIVLLDPSAFLCLNSHMLIKKKNHHMRQDESLLKTFYGEFQPTKSLLMCISNIKLWQRISTGLIYHHDLFSIMYFLFSTTLWKLLLLFLLDSKKNM